MNKRRKVVSEAAAMVHEPGRRGACAQIFVVGSLLLAAVSQAKLQIAEKDSTIKMATDMKRYVLTQDEPAKRGQILARDGEPLARDDSVTDLTIDFKKTPIRSPFGSNYPTHPASPPRN